MKKIFLLFSLFSFLFFLPLKTNAQFASLYLVPSSGTYTVGNTFSIQVKVNSGELAINAADGTLVFDADDLEIKSISKEGSVFSLWVQEPTFNNSLGTISFAGGKPSPGFAGASGTVFTVVFKVKTAGSTNLTFASASVLADDGKGTNILSSTKEGNYTFIARETITPPSEEEYVPASTPGGVPTAPVISSVTHPEEEKWYSNNDPELSWQLPADVTGVSLLLHEKPIANPGSQSDGLTTSKTYQDMEDGIWYFHIKFRNSYGWGQTTHRKVLIDTAPPEFLEVQFDNEGDPTNPSPILHFKSSDALSGIEYYEIKISEVEPIKLTVASLQHNPYKLPPQAPGTLTIMAKAVDGAGNFTVAKADLTIEPIGWPVITEYPQRLKVGDILTVKGTSPHPLSKVIIFIKREGGETENNEVETDNDGNWTYIHPKTLEKGDYTIWAIAVDKRGAQSNPTEKVKLEVSLPAVIKFGKIALDYLSIMITLIVLIVGAIAIGFYAWYRVSLWRKRVRKETKEVQESVSRAFKALKEEVEEQIEFLDEKPGLTKAERKVKDKLKEALDISEEFINKELKDVEKELE